MPKFPIEIEDKGWGVRIDIPDVGHIVITNDDWHNLDAMTVSTVAVRPEARGKGAGTKLYAVALEEACRRKRQLISDFSRSAFSEAFWRKQASKDRARCLKLGRGQYHDFPFTHLRSVLYDECAKTLEPRKAQRCAEKRFDDITRGLPRPRRREGEQFWPCVRWGFKKQSCGSSLEGLRARRRR